MESKAEWVEKIIEEYCRVKGYIRLGSYKRLLRDYPGFIRQVSEAIAQELEKE